MSGRIDEFGFPDFTADYDGRQISAAGGQTGSIVLLNGQTITFPWKRQQETQGTFPATVYVVESANVEYLYLRGPTLNGVSTRAEIYIAGFSDGTSSVGISDGTASMYVTQGYVQLPTTRLTGVTSMYDSGIITSGNRNVTITSTGSYTIDLTSAASLSVAATTSMSITAQASMDISSGVNMTLSATSNLSLLATNQGTLAAALISTQTTGTTGTSINHVNTSGGIQLNSYGSIYLTSSFTDSTGVNGPIALNEFSNVAVRANGKPIVPLLNKGTAMYGSAPLMAANAPGYKMQAGYSSVYFAAGSGTITFPTAFTNGLLTLILQPMYNDMVLAVNLAGGVSGTSATITGFIAGVAADGASYDVAWYAIGF